MKIALITIVNGASFGNRLQNYATQSVFQKLGYEIETINNTFEKNSDIKVYLQKIIGIAFSIIPQLRYKSQNWNRGFTFRKWDKCYISYSKAKLDASNYKEDVLGLNDIYNYFVVGSDQIWNPQFSSNSGFELLSFVPSQKRVSLSTSIGTETLPEQYLEMYKTELSKFKAISVREEKAAELVRSFVDIKVAVHIDPTLMVTKEEWKAFEKKPKKPITKEYILCFFLTNPDEGTKEIIQKFAYNKNLATLYLNRNMPGFEKISPNEFIYLVSHAKMVVTDSFHCTVFSLIFGVPLAVLDRFDADHVNSRLMTLLSSVSQEQFWLGRLNNMECMERNYKLAGYDIEPIIADKREQALKYIKTVCS